MAEAAKAAARRLPGFRLGKKQVFLPNHVITLLHKEYLPVNEACFQVPLRFTKLDLRDYLWNVYNVEIKKTRVYVKSQPLTQRSQSSNSWYRPLPLKIMTVELAQPFQWPEMPTSLEPWNNSLWKMREDQLKEQTDEQISAQKFEIPFKSQKPLSKERKDLANLAKEMLSGKVKWSNDVVLDPRWDHLLAKDKKGHDAATDGVANKDETAPLL